MLGPIFRPSADMQDKNYDYEFSFSSDRLCGEKEALSKGTSLLRHYQRKTFRGGRVGEFFCQPNDDDLHSARQH